MIFKLLYSVYNIKIKLVTYGLYKKKKTMDNYDNGN